MPTSRSRSRSTSTKPARVVAGHGLSAPANSLVSSSDRAATHSGRLAGQVAWVSGATSGIGLGIARLFAREGACVAVASNDRAAAKAVAEELNRQGGRAIAAPCDVASETQVRQSIHKTARAFGGLSILINNAGIVDIRPMHETTVAQWDRVMQVNVRSIFLSMKHGIEFLRKQPRSYVVNIGSVSSFVGQGLTPAYTTSKHAVMGLTRSIALDYAADGVRCNCVCPGITDTPMLRHHLSAAGDADERLRDRLKRVCMGVPLTPDDIARTVLYLSTQDSAGVTGTSVVVDAGYLAAAEWTHPGHTRFMEPIQ